MKKSELKNMVKEVISELRVANIGKPRDHFETPEEIKAIDTYDYLQGAKEMIDGVFDKHKKQFFSVQSDEMAAKLNKDAKQYKGDIKDAITYLNGALKTIKKG